MTFIKACRLFGVVGVVAGGAGLWLYEYETPALLCAGGMVLATIWSIYWWLEPDPTDHPTPERPFSE